MMHRKLALTVCLVLLSAAMVVAEENGTKVAKATKAADMTNTANTTNATNSTNATNTASAAGDSGAKTLRGMSVLGNNEAPMSLFIVPWKSSELGVEANVTRTLNERDLPVDREVFLRELDFYQVSVEGKTK